MDRTLMARAGLSAGLAAATCLAIANLIFAAVMDIGSALLWSAWCAGVTLGLTWAGTYFGVRLGSRAGRAVHDQVSPHAGS